MCFFYDVAAVCTNHDLGMIQPSYHVFEDDLISSLLQKCQEASTR